MDLGQAVPPKPHRILYNPKYTVFGYVRSSQTSLFKASSYSLFQNIPIAITSLCVSYYEPIEYFDIINTYDIESSEDKKSISKYSDRQLTITSGARIVPPPPPPIITPFMIGLQYMMTTGSHSFSGAVRLDNTSFGKISIPSTSKAICKWYFKINHISNEFEPEFKDPFRIGIVSKISSTNKSFMDKAQNEDYKFYGYQLGSEILESHHGTNEVPTYERQPRVNYTYCMTLDLQKREIRYSRNNKSLGIAFDNIDIGDDIEYKLAVTIGYKYGKISILKYVETL